MTNPHDQPLSRRAARRAEQAENGSTESFAQPTSGERPRRGSPTSVPTSVPSEITYRTQARPRVPHYDERSVAVAPPMAPPVVAPPVAPSAPPGYEAPRVRRRDFRPPAVSDEPPAPVEPPAFDTPLEYHTQLTEPVAHSAPLEQTLSRRELRELRASQSAPVQTTESATSAPILIQPVAVEPPVVGSVAPEPAAVAQPPVGHTATGAHWSVGIHDDEDPFENTFSREVGSHSSLSTNALVLPEMPTGTIAGPVHGTGEIIVTGMIAVSSLHSSTGTVSTLHDGRDLDDLFDVSDREVSAPDSAPVSALKAVSSHSATHTVMTGKPSSSNTVTTVLVASTVVMAVVAIGLFVVAAMNGLF